MQNGILFIATTYACIRLTLNASDYKKYGFDWHVSLSTLYMNYDAD